MRPGMPLPITDEELQARADALYWWHALRLRPGVVTKGPKTEAILAAESDALFAGVALPGASVLDIGAWNGHFSLDAKRRGAARVLATDSYAWDSPFYRGRETIELAVAELGLPVELRRMAPDELGPEVGRFDVVLFLGVFYHLLDPIQVLPRLRAATGGLLLLETHLDGRDTAQPRMVFYPGSELGADSTNWWGPNIACVDALLRAHGFGRVLYREHPCGLLDRGLFAAWPEPAPTPLTAGMPAAGWTDLGEAGAVERLVLSPRASLAPPPTPSPATPLAAKPPSLPGRLLGRLLRGPPGRPLGR